MSTTIAPRDVLVPLGRGTAPRYRLVCVPFAGGGAGVYRPWRTALPSTVQAVAIRLPGREALIDADPLDRIEPVVDLLASALSELRADGVPYGLFGHSMGALVSYAVAARLDRDGGPPPRHLFVAGRRGAHIPDPLPAIHRMPREEFVREVRALNGFPQEVLDQPQILELLVPALQADFAVCETYRYPAGPPLSCAISAFGGAEDPTTTPEQLAGWRQHTSGEFRMRMYPGDHFFIGPQRAEILAAIVADVTASGIALTEEAPA